MTAATERLLELWGAWAQMVVVLLVGGLLIVSVTYRIWRSRLNALLDELEVEAVQLQEMVRELEAKADAVEPAMDQTDLELAEFDRLAEMFRERIESVSAAVEAGTASDDEVQAAREGLNDLQELQKLHVDIVHGHARTDVALERLGAQLAQIKKGKAKVEQLQLRLNRFKPLLFALGNVYPSKQGR